ncbi:acetate uptake transporter [Methanolobus sp. WCC5]|uniref:acetate uptake transporter n=1 Tax=Methanolobus sp. WCC5 TaxID=3125785 RepID=UPI00324EDECE
MDGEITIKDTTASPAPLGFFGLGFAATFLGLMVMGIFSDAVMVISTAIFLGGFAQLFASFELWKKGDTFGASAFGAFALFWFSWAFIQIATTIGIFGGVMEAMSASAGFWYLIIWGIIATLLTIVTFKIGLKAIVVTFILLDLTFFSLAFIGGMIAGVITLLLGLASLYTAVAIIMNEVGKLNCPGLCPPGE